MSSDSGCVNQLCDPLAPGGGVDTSLFWARSLSAASTLGVAQQMFLNNSANQPDFIMPVAGVLLYVWGYVCRSSPLGTPYPAPTEIDVYSLVNGVEVGKVSFDSTVSPVLQKSLFPGLVLNAGDIVSARTFIRGGVPIPSSGVANYGMVLRLG